MLGENRCLVRGLVGSVCLLACFAGACRRGGGGGGGSGQGATGLGPVTMLSPEPGQSNVPVRPTFQWDREQPAASYKLFVWAGETAPGKATASTERPSYTPDEALEYATTYSWRVDAIEGSGARSTGPVQTFTTIVEAVPILAISRDDPWVVKAGETVSFSVSADDPADSIRLTARDVPAGAVWSDASALVPSPVLAPFSWTPKPADQGLHTVTFFLDDAGGLEAAPLPVFISVVSPFKHPLDLASLDGTDGVVLLGSRFKGEAGYSVSGLGDVNGDGYADLGVSAPKPGLTGIEPGDVFVIFGKPGLGTGGTLDLAALGGTDGFAIQGMYAMDLLGSSLSGAGDIDGDGFCDIVIGAPLAKSDADHQGGEAYVLFGASDLGAGGQFDLATLDGTNGFVLTGDGQDNLGSSVSGAGDINRDGFDDFIVGAPSAQPLGRVGAGEAVLVFGASDVGTGGRVDLTKLDAGAGAYLMGVAKDDQCGRSVSGAGDFNGDGYPDILIGAPLADNGGRDRTGEAYLLFGGLQFGFKGSVDLAALDGSQGFVLRGVEAEMQAGWIVAGAGDLNGDGLAEIAIGRTKNTTGDGEVFVVFGSEILGKGGEEFLDDQLLDGDSGFHVEGLSLWGVATAGAGDVNGDGLGDLLVGAAFNDVDNALDAGQAYIIYGAQDVGSSGRIHVDSLDGAKGIALLGDQPSDLAGWSVSAAGDVDGDGLGDLLVGAVTADAGTLGSDAGQAYVVYGRPATFIGRAFGVDPPSTVAAGAIGVVNDGSDASSPAVRSWIGWNEGKFESLTDVNLYRTRTGLFGEGLTRADLARVTFQFATSRVDWTKARVTLGYSDAEVKGLDETALHLLVSPDRYGPWREIDPVAVLPAINRIAVDLAPGDLGFLVISQ